MKKRYFINFVLLFSLCVLTMSVSAQNVRKVRSGIIVVDEGSRTRALEPFNGVATGGEWYADAINKYGEAFAGKANVYCMVIPTAVEFYCPDAAKAWTHDEKPVLQHIYSHLSKDVKGVDVYQALKSHSDETIYSRTDHHWSPLGAYYAANEFARTAGVTFKDLTSYDKMTIKNFIGSMYYYSKDIAVKNAPEDFVYYKPRNIEYTTTYINHELDRNHKVSSMSDPFSGDLFKSYSDGSSSAYMTFLGGDLRTAIVKTSTTNGRRLLIIKDSYGNALPGYLLYAFEEIRIIDFRYFTKHITDYVDENNITDILFANNLQHAYSKSTSQAYLRLL